MQAHPKDALTRRLRTSFGDGIARVVYTQAGAVILHVRCDLPASLALALPPQAAVAVIVGSGAVQTIPLMADQDAADGDATLIANLERGATLHFEGRVDLLWVHLPHHSFNGLSGQWQLQSAPPEPGIHGVPKDAVARHLAMALLSRDDEGCTGNAVFKNAMTSAFQSHFLRTYCARQSPAPAAKGMTLAPWQLRMAEQVMLSRLDHRMSIAEVADTCGISAVHFSRAFRRTTNETPHRWLMRRRLESACALLARSDESVADIALSCGFSDQSHLTRIFATTLGTTPAQWRDSQRATR